MARKEAYRETINDVPCLPWHFFLSCNCQPIWLDSISSLLLLSSAFLSPSLYLARSHSTEADKLRLDSGTVIGRSSFSADMSHILQRTVGRRVLELASLGISG